MNNWVVKISNFNKKSLCSELIAKWKPKIKMTLLPLKPKSATWWNNFEGWNPWNRKLIPYRKIMINSGKIPPKKTGRSSLWNLNLKELTISSSNSKERNCKKKSTRISPKNFKNNLTTWKEDKLSSKTNLMKFPRTYWPKSRPEPN